MAIEIERKFLVKNTLWKTQVQSETRLQQGYLTESPKRSVRIRTGNERAFLNIKSQTSENGIERLEFEYEIPFADAQQLLSQAALKPFIEKTRYKVLHAGFIWDLDVFELENKGLIVAEIELESADQAFELPAWAGAEVSDDPRYYNMNLIRHPYSQWEK